MIEMPELVKSVCRVLYYRQLTRLSIAGVECIASLAIDSILQMHLIQVSPTVGRCEVGVGIGWGRGGEGGWSGGVGVWGRLLA